MRLPVELENNCEKSYRQDFPGDFSPKDISSLGANNESSLRLSSLPSYKNVLLLQGPVGPFFLKLAKFLEQREATAHKINFNAGDEWFYSPKRLNTSLYRHTLDFWPNYLEKYIIQNHIEAIFVFGDCRPIHQPAKLLCQKYSIDLWAFEEGYFRPNHFTMELFGVNAYSRLSKVSLELLPKTESSITDSPMTEPLKTYDRSHIFMARNAFVYWLMNIMQSAKSENYDHHRELNLAMGYRWAKNVLSYFYYDLKDRPIQKKLTAKFLLDKTPLFLFPLQVHDDAQIVHHSKFESIEEAIQLVVTSFHRHIQINTGTKPILVIKHHPMDRGHKNYSSYIKRLSATLGLEDCVYYLHNLDLDSIASKLLGCITVNSTYGLKALCQGVPVINLGASFYDKPGITFQKSLDEFWHNPATVSLDKVDQFKRFIISQTQVNGCLYSPEYQVN
jgi:capsular polysaccharide export protein